MKKGIKFEPKSDIRRLAVIFVAAVLNGFNIKILVNAGGLYPGGANGVTVLIQRIAQQYYNVALPYTIINLLVNAIPVYIGFRYIGKKFTLYSLVMILVSGVLTDMIPSYAVTYDTLLISVFGGIINGLVISLCLSVDATTGGTDFISIYLSQKRGVDSWNIILGINVVILLVAGYFFGLDKALYSLFFQYASTQAIHVLYRNYRQDTLLIVTNRAQEISESIYALGHHGATIIHAEGSYELQERDIVYSVVAASQTKKVTNVVHKVDPHAFVNVISTERIKGRFYQSPKD